MSMIVTMAANENISVDDGDDIQLLQQEGQASEQEQQQEERDQY